MSRRLEIFEAMQRQTQSTQVSRRAKIRRGVRCHQIALEVPVGKDMSCGRKTRKCQSRVQVWHRQGTRVTMAPLESDQRGFAPSLLPNYLPQQDFGTDTGSELGFLHPLPNLPSLLSHSGPPFRPSPTASTHNTITTNTLCPTKPNF